MLRHVKRAARAPRYIKRAVKRRTSATRDYIYFVDNPSVHIIDDRTLVVDGWIISNKDKEFSLRVRNNDKIYAVKRGVRRPDVAQNQPQLPKEKTLKSGFRSEFEFDDGEIAVELDDGKGYQKIFSTTVQFGIEKLPTDLYNKDLARNYPEHVNLLANKKQLYYEDSLEGNFKRHDKDPRLMAIYLPQFHPFAENDIAWGKGFTEWTNVTTAQPRFIGHQQPILPKDLGFYDLRLESKILEQIELAKKYGVYGFCFYYYWFSGKKLIDAPLNSFLKHKEWDFNFTICWANENWTKRWDGRDSEVIIAQEYLEDDPLNFIKDVESILLDKRYIQEDGKPVLMVYRASELKDPAGYAKTWREYFRSKHGKELHLVSFLSFDVSDPRTYGFDMALDFAPQSGFFKNEAFKENKYPFTIIDDKLLDINFQGQTADYRQVALTTATKDHFDFPTYPSVTPAWDNDARKKGKGFIMQNNSPDLYAEWLDAAVTRVADKDAPLVFVNAWNEWAEGAIMEPTMHYGHAVLNRTVEVLAKHSKDKDATDVFPLFGIRKSPKHSTAVVIHMYYPEQWDYLRTKIDLLKDIGADLFVTLNAKDQAFAETIREYDANAQVFIVPNRGRDVLAFMHIARRLDKLGYSNLLKLHSKKSKHRTDGHEWFNSLVDSLLPSEAIAKDIISHLDDAPGLVGPKGHFVSLKRHMGSNEPHMRHILTDMYDRKRTEDILSHTEDYGYFAGTMFWASLETLRPLLNMHFLPEDFESEAGQIDGTLAHTIERLLTTIVYIQGQALLQSSTQGVEIVTNADITTSYDYAP